MSLRQGGRRDSPAKEGTQTVWSTDLTASVSTELPAFEISSTDLPAWNDLPASETVKVTCSVIAAPASHGRAVQVGPLKPKLKPPGTKRLKPKCDILLSTSAFNFNLRHYILGQRRECPQQRQLGHCQNAIESSEQRRQLTQYA
jgi:hypothetical protein